MLQSIAFILIFGLLAQALFKKIRFPHIIGMLIVGILIGPYGFELLDQSILNISGDIRQIALIIILLKAGLTMDVHVLKKVGRPAVLMCFLPASFEMLGYLLFAPKLLGITLLEAGIIGAVMGAVSPAVVIPAMSRLMDSKWGTEKGIPQMITAGASMDDIFVIVVFTSLIAMAEKDVLIESGLAGAGASGGSGVLGNGAFGGGAMSSILAFGQVPIAIILGILVGILGGLLMNVLFRRFHIRDTIKMLILLAVAFLFMSLENALKGVVPVSGLLAVMAMGMTIYEKKKEVAGRLAARFNKLWVAAEIFLFVLVGALVNIQFALDAGGMMILMLFIGLIFRLAGAYVCQLKTPLNGKERLFCMIAELPKATVQAAIGGVALQKGLACGNLVLTIAVVAIIITAPLGAFGIERSYQKLLVHENEQ